MKISKTTRWILTIGILAILLISLGVIYGHQKAEQSELNTNIAQARQSLLKHTTKYATEKRNLETRLSEAEFRIASVQDEFRKYTQSIEINKTLFEAAEDANVTITELSSSLPEEEEIGIEEKEGGDKKKERVITFQFFSINLTAEAEVVPALLNFSNKISERFPTATIESVTIDIPEPVEEGKSEGKSSITLSLKIHAYEGK
jgi:hypothetical protein